MSALRSDLGASYAIISQLPSDKFQIVLTIPLYLEYQDVLTRPEHMSGKSSKDDIINFLRYICSIAYKQQIYYLWRPWVKDPKDDMVLEAAVGSQSKYLVTHNLNDFKEIDTFFGIKAVTPGKFLHILSIIKQNKYTYHEKAKQTKFFK